jgi:hypothetical protein
MSSRTNSRSSKVSSIVDSINGLFVEFLNSQANAKGKVKIEVALEALKSEEMVGKIKELANAFLPKRKTSQKLKDPQAPKKPLNAYMIFCKSERESVKSELPDLSSKEIMKELAQRWKTISDKKKRKFKKKEEALKEEYKMAMESYQRPSDEELAKLKVNQPKEKSAAGKKRKPRAKKDPNAPKKPRSAYVFFCQGMRDEIKRDLGEDATAEEVREELACTWREHKEDEYMSHRWNKLAKKDKKRYEKEMAAYKLSKEAESAEPAEPAEPESEDVSVEPEVEPERKLKKRKVHVEI